MWTKENTSKGEKIKYGYRNKQKNKKAFYEAYNEYQNLEEHPELIQDIRALYALKRKLTVYSVLADRFGQGLFTIRVQNSTYKCIKYFLDTEKSKVDSFKTMMELFLEEEQAC